MNGRLSKQSPPPLWGRVREGGAAPAMSESTVIRPPYSSDTSRPAP
jgi:hypothetical protein